MRHLPTLAAVVLCASPAALAGARRTAWELRAWTYAKLVPQDRPVARDAKQVAKPNQHPAQVDPEALRARLAELEAQGDDEPLFEKKELQDLIKPLAAALAEAHPDEDVALVSTDRRGHGLLAPALAATARVFVEDGQVNLIFHDTRLDFYGRVYTGDRSPNFVIGARAAASRVVLKPVPGMTLKRADWIQFPVPAPAPVAAPAAPPAPVAAPAPAPAPAPAAAPAAPQAKPVAATVEERLRALKKLYDEKLITEEEYRKKKENILAAL